MRTKEIKLDGYTLPERVKAKMILKLFKTHRAKKELGFTLCSKPDNIIIASEDITGTSDGIIIDPRMCKEDERFLGGYHTHPTEDSSAGAEDLHYCGIFKIICTGGKTDNKIKCNTWKYEEQSEGEHNKMADDIRKGVTESKNPRYQPNFDCIRTTDPLFSDEKYIKYEMDKNLDTIESLLSTLKKSGSTESTKRMQNALIVVTEARDIIANRLKEKIKNVSKKYYNETEII